MRRTLGTVFAVVLLCTGCGATGQASDRPSSQAAPSPTSGPVEHRLVALVSASHVGGNVSAEAAVLDDAAAVAAFGDRFEGPRMGALVESAVAAAEVGPDEALLGAVVAVGCDSPTQVSVERRGRRLLVRPGRIPSSRQCLVPVTTVALVAVADSSV